MTKLQKIEKDLFYTVFAWGKFNLSIEQPDSKLYESPTFKMCLEAYKNEILRLAKQEEIEGMFKEEVEKHLRDRHPYISTESSCGYAGCPAK